MSLLDDIPEGSLVALDTMVWIYEFESHPVFGPIVHPFFRDRLDTAKNRAGSSLLTLGELLVQPLAVGRNDIADQYRQLFTPGPVFSVWDITRDVVEQAAALRAKHRVKMLDAVHVAAAILNGATIFISNEEGLRRVTELKVLVLADYVPPPSP